MVLAVVNQLVVINQTNVVVQINFNIKSISCNQVKREWNLHKYKFKLRYKVTHHDSGIYWLR